MVRYHKSKGVILDTVTSEIIFADESEISDYAIEAIKLLNELGVMGGVGNNIIYPQGQATRAQAAAMLHQIISSFAAEGRERR